MILMTVGWTTRILLIPDLVFTLIYPIKLPMFLLYPLSFSKAVAMFSVLLGAIKSFNVDRFGHTKAFLLWVLALLMTPVSAFLETCGIIAGLLSLSCNDFYIVDKDQIIHVYTEQYIMTNR
ncbi:hypothetical protein KUTeg_018334 [Tegillarca granosa]|uniref:Uncharacterized protein n=1 Tax=Tegillarca granosa TaxID=220873 RepID=A0ABQ9ELL1_TEGGR|nr:hypothetical protein KUTeg_018334 [Tegillarca granosa]